MKRLSLGILILLATSTSFALDVRAALSQKRNFLGVSGEFSQFKIDEGGGSITGQGLRLDLSHSFSDRVNLELFISSAVNSTGGIQASFTGLGGYAMYNIFGNCCQEEKTVFVDGKALINETIEKGSSLQVGAGLDQYFLNGSKAVYSSSGLGIAVNYQFKIFRYNFKAGYRHSQLSSGQTKIGGDFVSLGMVFSL